MAVGMEIRPLDVNRRDTAAAVLALQQASYPLEAELIGSYDIPPLQDTAEALQSCGETFIGCFECSELAGMVSYKAEGGVLDIHRLAVHPDYLRRGIGRALLAYLEESADNVERMLVSTGKRNEPAVQLYRKCGFEYLGDITAKEGIVLSRFEKPLTGRRP